MEHQFVTGQMRGLLNETQSLKNCTFDRFKPPPDLSEIIAWFWLVRWNLPEGQIYHQSNLPHPVQHLVIDPQQNSGLFGCTKSRFDYNLTGKGAVLGAHFHPAAASTVYEKSMNSLTDSFCDFPLPTEYPSPELIASLCQSIRNERRPLSDSAREMRTIVEMIDEEPNILRVNDIVRKTNIGIRQLQRLFAEYVGVSPKWVIDRYRMFEALTELNHSRAVNLADLALRLEYTDQAHFSRQFKKITGYSPGTYLSAQNYSCARS